MTFNLVKRARYRVRRAIGFPDNGLAVRIVGHRDYVGGLWEELGLLQWQFLTQHGVRPTSTVLDIACGSLRAGRYLIPYLNPGNYLGLDKNELLVQRGMRYEIPAQILKEKKPEFVISNCFEFERFSRPATYSMAQSLFTHLNEGDVRVCLEKLYRWAEPGHTLFASFDPSCRRRNPRDSHSSLKFYYSVDHLSTVGEASGWQTDYVGDWGHPRGLMLMRFRK